MRQAWLTYVFVGAGYAGLEGLAELQDFAADVIELYPRCRTQGMRWILVEAQDRVMPEVQPSLAEFATRELRGRGIEIRTRTTLDEVTDDDGAAQSTARSSRRARSRGPRACGRTRSIAELGLPLDGGGRIRTDRTMRVEGFDNVWAIGDAAAVPDPAKLDQRHRRRPRSTRSARAAASRATSRRRSAAARSSPFRYKTLGVFVDMGRGEAVASTLGIKWRGAPAWWLARTYHLAMMPGFKRKLRLLVDWNVGLLFGRDASELGGLGHAPRLGRGERRRDRQRRRRLQNPPPEAEALHAPVLPQRRDGHALARGVDHPAVAQRDADVRDVRPRHALPDPRAAEEQQVAGLRLVHVQSLRARDLAPPSPPRCGRGSRAPAG